MSRSTEPCWDEVGEWTVERRARCPQPGGQPPQEGSSELERDSRAGPVLRLLLTHFVSRTLVRKCCCPLQKGSLNTMKWSMRWPWEICITSCRNALVPSKRRDSQGPRVLPGSWEAGCQHTGAVPLPLRGAGPGPGLPHISLHPSTRACASGLMGPLHVTLWIQERCEPTQ